MRSRDFKEPATRHGQGSKLTSLKKLIAEREDIVTTHALFALADDELIELLEWQNYSLIIDEVMDVMEQIDLRKDDIKLLIESRQVEINEDTKQVKWLGTPDMDTRFNDIMNCALSGNLYCVNNTAFVWCFPVKLFSCFSEVFILTYIFDGQLQKYYYDFHSVRYEYYSVEYRENEYVLIPKQNDTEAIRRGYISKLIEIYEGDLNDIGDKKTSLSKSWFVNSKNAPNVKVLKNNLYNYFRHKTKSKADNFLWTTFKDYKRKVQGSGYTREEISNTDTDINEKGSACYTAFNLRATNRYKHKTTLAFLLNRYMNPIEKHFYLQRGIEVNENLLALSDLLQWIFRSAIRDNKRIKLNVPSKCMRCLLIAWLNNEI